MFRYRLFTVLVLLLPAVCHAQAQVELPPGVDYPRVNVGTGYQVDESWPAGKSAYPWKAMPGIAIDAEGMIWTVNRGEMPVQVYSPDGKLVTQWGKDYFISPHQIKIGRGGNVWVVDSHAHAVYKFTREGDKLLTIGVPGEPGDDDQHLKMPTDVIESPSGDLFISDGYRNNRVVHCNARGRFIRTWGELGVEPGQFSLPHAIDMDSRGRIYVADRNNCRVQVFSQRGKFLAEWKNLCMPWTVRVTSKDEVYVCGASPSQWRSDDVQLGIPPKDQVVLKLDTTGRLLSWWHFPSGPDEVDMGVKPGELSWVHGLAVDAEGNLYLGDIMGQRAQRFMLSK